MQQFTLVDLFSQRSIVSEIVKDMTEEEIIKWLEQYGTIIVKHNVLGNIYSFQSKVGIQVTFVFANGGMLFHQGDHNFVK